MNTSYALIADPDVVAAHVFLSAVREVGLGTVVVRDGTVALTAMLERGAPALLIAELALPGLDGFELVEGMRRALPDAKTPVVLVSADRDLRERAQEWRAKHGVAAILARAASDDSVRRVIRRILGVDQAVAGARGGAEPASGPRTEEPATPRRKATEPPLGTRMNKGA